MPDKWSLRYDLVADCGGLLGVVLFRLLGRGAVVGQRAQRVILYLKAGMRVMLPSGNIVVLVQRERSSWTCEYTVLARQRGLVEFNGLWLRRWAREV